MYLKSVELYGFKSFANKMIFKFDKGITGIVGPNGSGKSNIADAVRWVLGEQSPKQLRGSKMEDVIFAGTVARKQLGYCQVDLTIDNHDKKMPIDYLEVTVSRRVYRSGESGYYINGKQCRLKDVSELFMDTGVGQEGYSIIGQGQVEKILSNKPEERRMLIDEAAGIVKYKTRKQSAEKKLIKAEDDLVRVLDIILELESRRQTLDQQKEVAKIYLKLREELKKLEITSFINLINDFDRKLEEQKQSQQMADQQLTDKQQEYKQIIDQYKELEEKYNQIEREVDTNQDDYTSTSLSIEKYSSDIRLGEEKIKNIQAQIERSQEEISKLETVEITRRQEINSHRDQIGFQDKKIAENQAVYAKREEIYHSILAEINMHQAEIEQYNSNQLTVIKQTEQIKGEIEKNELQKENHQNKMSHLLSKIKISQETVTDLQEELDSSQTQLDAYEEKQKQYLDHKLKIRKNISDLEDKLRQHKEELNRQFHNVNVMKSKREALVDMEENYDGYFYSVKKIMELKDEQALGIVAELITVDKKYEKAIEIALGSNIQNIVTKDEQAAKRFIEYLKKHKYGRGTFLPLTTVKGKAAGDIQAVSGYLGIASEIIDCQAQYRPILRQLLGRILIVDTMDHGLELAKANHRNYRIITLDGDVISPGGAMSGGAFAKEKGQLLARKNEIDALNQMIAKNETEIEKRNQIGLALEDELLGFNEKIEEIRVDEQKLNFEMHSLATIVSNNQTEIEQYKQEIQAASQETEQLQQQIETLTRSNQENKQKRQEIKANSTDSEQKINQLKEFVGVLKLDMESIQAELAAIKLEYSELSLEKKHIEETIERLSQSLTQKTSTIEEISSQIKSLELSKLREQQLLSQNQQLQQKQQQQLEQLEESLKTLRYDRTEIGVAKGQLDSKREIIAEQKNSLEKELVRITSNVEKLEVLRESRISYMWEEYELTYSTAQAYYMETDLSEAAMKRKTNSIKQEMKELGDVNVKAIEEFREVDQRYTFLTAQRDDLLQSKEKLLDIIRHLDKEMIEQFISKFNQINHTFNKVFKELFGGGSGHLKLIDSEDVLESGIAINVQPPGKKLQNMMLLSGGERSFTAIALLFAIQSLRPSPFCVLDEIEAALDDANVIKFAQYLQKLTEQTQFIVITHRKGTMEAADSLYGITMQEKGVSTQVSVKLIEDQLENKAG